MSIDESDDAADELDIEQMRQDLAESFDRDLDPLAKLAPKFDQAPLAKYDLDDYFKLFKVQRLDGRDLRANTVAGYERSWRQWYEFMAREGRHPCCPNDKHVERFIKWQRDELENSEPDVTNKVTSLNSMYEYWQDSGAFPHGDEDADVEGYNPFAMGRERVSWEPEEEKEPPFIPIERLREIVGGINHLRNQALVVIQLKLGLRATEVCNIKVSEITIDDPDLRDHYDEMGTADPLDGRENAVYIPSRFNRKGNKSKRPRVLALDDELRRVLLKWLLIRPDNPRPWLFLSDNHGRLQADDINRVWKGHFQPEFEETEHHDSVTSHYGRHRFTSHWEKEGISHVYKQYMRGDTTGISEKDQVEAIDTYIHVYYEDIEELCRHDIYRLKV